MRTWLIAMVVLQLFGPSVNKKNKEGAELYEEGKLDEALVAYTQAQEESPDASEIQYNIANVHYRKEEMDKALDGYRTARSGSDEVQRRSHFNTGNVLYKGETFPDAVAAYKEALKIDDQDIEARQNLELALRKKEERQRQQEQEGGGDSGESEKQQDQSQPQPQDQAMDSSDQRGEAQPQGMSKEEAERILAALAEMEKAEQRKQQQKRQIKAPAKGKDW
ncbi:MAG: tetratricopeptide repeat protein [Vicinamibacteria bacterium]